jgi:hypothetical protein
VGRLSHALDYLESCAQRDGTGSHGRFCAVAVSTRDNVTFFARARAKVKITGSEKSMRLLVGGARVLAHHEQNEKAH